MKYIKNDYSSSDDLSFRKSHGWFRSIILSIPSWSKRSFVKTDDVRLMCEMASNGPLFDHFSSVCQDLERKSLSCPHAVEQVLLRSDRLSSAAEVLLEVLLIKAWSFLPLFAESVNLSVHGDNADVAMRRAAPSDVTTTI